MFADLYRDLKSYYKVCCSALKVRWIFFVFYFEPRTAEVARTIVVHASEMEGGCSSTSSLAIAMLLLLSTRYVKMNLGSPDDDLKPRWFGKIRQCRASERYSVTAVH